MRKPKQKAPQIDPEDPWVVSNMGEVGRFWGITRGAVKEWITHGCPRVRLSAKRSLYDLSAIAKWRREKDLDARANANGNPWAQMEKEYQAKLKELQFREKKEGLISREDVVADVRELLVILRTQLMAAKQDFPLEFHEEYERILRDAFAQVTAYAQEQEEAIARANDGPQNGGPS